jgi:hypothetical protein
MAFTNLFRCKWLGDGSRTLPEMADKLEEAAKRLREMSEAGVRLDGKVEDDYAELICDDPQVAEKYGLKDAEEDEAGEYDEEDFDDEDEGFQ